MKYTNGMKKFKFTAIIILFLISSCDYFFPPLSSDKVTVTEAYNFLRNNRENKDVIILDLRSKTEYNIFHVKGAINFDYRETTFPGEIEKLERNKRYLIFSRGSKESYNTLELMKELRFTKSHAVTGGMEEWIKENFPKDF